MHLHVIYVQIYLKHTQKQSSAQQQAESNNKRKLKECFIIEVARKNIYSLDHMTKFNVKGSLVVTNPKRKDNTNSEVSTLQSFF